MPSEHAKLSPSASERWITCQASVRLIDSLDLPPDEGSTFAAEGTAAHTMGELKVRRDLLDDPNADSELGAFRAELTAGDHGWDLDDMDRHTDRYVAVVRERAALYPDAQVLVEQRMDTGVPRCWGTSDIVIVSPEHVEIIDLKFGQGVLVDADDNSQLRLYALGALDTFGDLLGDTQLVRITVYQPRLDNVQTEEITPGDLRAWRDEVAVPAAEAALSDDAPFGPSEKACRWCPASGRCRAQLEDVFAEDDFDAAPDQLTPDEVAEALGRVKAVKHWLASLEEVALTMAYSEGKTLPGYKVVSSGGRRVIDDVDGAVEALSHAGFAADDVAPRKMNGIGKLEKLLGEDFGTLLGPYVRKSEGRPSLVPSTDRRRAINPATEAAREFGEEPE